MVLGFADAGEPGPENRSGLNTIPLRSGIWLVCLGVAACAPVYEPPVLAAFQCGNTYVRKSFRGDDLRLEMFGKTWRLSRVISVSGARYASVAGAAHAQFWENGGEALLERGPDEMVRCVLIDPVSSQGRV